MNDSLEGKPFEELTVEDLQNVKITFAPGSFDEFDGTQEELDELIAEVTRLIRSGEILENSESIDLDELLESDDPDDHRLAQKLFADPEQTPPRNLQ